jgi:CDP-glycerol glycerophosphotransferase (TagB/SpsB family)
MCSTTALDAAVLDRPVIGIAFASVIKSKETEVYREAYRSHHYRPLVESGGLRLARDWGELFALIRRAIKCPEEDRLARRLMIDQECGLVDGRAAERITKVILGLLKR